MLHIPRPFIQLRQSIKELVEPQVPGLSLLARPIVEKLRVAQREACQKRAAGQVGGLLELRQPRFMRLTRERFNPAPDLLAGRFDEAEVQHEWATLVEPKRIAFNQQVSPLAWSVTTLKELAQLEQGSA